jgi:hypothetical protein
MAQRPAAPLPCGLLDFDAGAQQSTATRIAERNWIDADATVFQEGDDIRQTTTANDVPTIRSECFRLNDFLALNTGVAHGETKIIWRHVVSFRAPEERRKRGDRTWEDKPR